MSKKKLTREEMLSSRPVRNQVLEWEKKNNKILVTFKRKSSKWVTFLSKFFYIPEKRTLELDSVGAQVWEKCNGDWRVQDIIESLVQENRLEYKEAEMALLEFLKKLAKKKMVGFQVSKKEDEIRK